MYRIALLLLVAVLPLSGCLGKGLSMGGSGGNVQLADLEGHRWKAVTLNGQPVQVFDNQDEPHLVFFDLNNNTAHVAGSDGCNRVIGDVTLTEGKVQFSHLGSTMMACPKGFEQSQAFKENVAKTSDWAMKGDNLTLLEGDVVLLELAPVNID